MTVRLHAPRWGSAGACASRGSEKMAAALSAGITLFTTSGVLLTIPRQFSLTKRRVHGYSSINSL